MPTAVGYFTVFLAIVVTQCLAFTHELIDEIKGSPDREKFVQLSENFIMTTVADSEILRPDDDEFSPDGRYTPRIVFLSPDGTRIGSITNTARHKQYLHFYDRLDDIIKGMQQALTYR
ncbi:unnamed protein product [Gongylonema pulchrum]|uniref:AhpC-TSA domain-containing protein n=1 Tax=Gongylonema pulchrum TaxID=637853 RepID=A0A183CUJ5_9BILA|nr:unnamed protein product [Gongylonema pulchrum]